MKAFLQKIAPMAFTILGGIILGGLALRAVQQSSSLSDALPLALFAAIYCVWMIIESRVTRGELHREHTDLDNFTMELAAVVKTTLLIGLVISPLGRPMEAVIGGFTLAIAGIGLRVWAIRAIGTHYSHRIRIPSEVLKVGPYKILRHPAYLGTGLAHTGFTIVFYNPFALIALLCWWGVILVRVITEEKAYAASGPYQAYRAAVTAKLIPFIW
jgi:protein-S-isoprenylcysteine O-methyltransferase Ste14